MVDAEAEQPQIAAHRNIRTLGFGFHPRRAQDDSAEQRHEGHGHDVRSDERCGHHDRQAVNELADGAGDGEERQIRYDVGDRGEQNGAGQAGRPHPRRRGSLETFEERALDAVASDDRHVDEQPERENESCDADLLNVDAQHLHESEGHGQGDGNGQRHDKCGSPIPKADERHQHDEHDGFVEAAHE